MLCSKESPGFVKWQPIIIYFTTYMYADVAGSNARDHSSPKVTTLVCVLTSTVLHVYNVSMITES